MGRTCGCKLLMKMGFGQLWLILAVTIFGAANAFTQKLMTLLMTLGTNAEGGEPHCLHKIRKFRKCRC